MQAGQQSIGGTDKWTLVVLLELLYIDRDSESKTSQNLYSTLYC